MRRKGWLVLICLAVTLRADEPKDVRTSENDRRVFEQQFESLFERHCDECHSHRAKELRGGLTLRFGGRDFRLTDVYGRVLRDILA